MQPIEDLLKAKYEKYVNSGQLHPLNHELAKVILSYKPDSAFEFGCNRGRNLLLLAPHVPLIYGIDMSEPAIEKAREHTRLRYCNVGNDKDLQCFKQFDVVFTCSVLNHIPHVTDIVAEFKRIAKKAVILAETQDIVDWNYFSHDYESMGFKKLDYEWQSNDKGQRYNIWVFEK